MLGKTNGGGGGFDPSEIQSGTIAVDNILGLDALGDIVKGNLTGQYVRVIPAPASTTLTDELIAVFKEGVFVNGAFLGLTNPVFFPCAKEDSEHDYWGIVIGLSSSAQYTYCKSYTIDTSKVISAPKQALRVLNASGALNTATLSITQNLTIKSKAYPDYPTTNTTPKVLQIAPNGGSLSWGDVPSPAVVAYEGTSLLPTDVVFEDWTLHRAIKDGNVLWVVVSGKIKNNGSSSATIANLCSITLPAEISSKIYLFNGTTLDNPTNDDILISACTVDTSSVVKLARLSSSGANTIVANMYTSLSLNANQSVAINIRIPIFLNIGD